MNQENIIRKIDKLGRISVPKGLRDRFGIVDGDEIEFYSTLDGFICMRKVGYESNTSKYKIAVEALAELGYVAPEELATAAGMAVHSDSAK